MCSKTVFYKDTISIWESISGKEEQQKLLVDDMGVGGGGLQLSGSIYHQTKLVQMFRYDLSKENCANSLKYCTVLNVCTRHVFKCKK